MDSPAPAPQGEQEAAVTSKYLNFVEVPYPTRKTKVFEVRAKSNGFQLGMIGWHGGWRQYVFTPTRSEETIWSEGCLRDLADFIAEKMAEWRKRR